MQLPVVYFIIIIIICCIFLILFHNPVRFTFWIRNHGLTAIRWNDRWQHSMFHWILITRRSPRVLRSPVQQPCCFLILKWLSNFTQKHYLMIQYTLLMLIKRLDFFFVCSPNEIWVIEFHFHFHLSEVWCCSVFNLMCLLLDGSHVGRLMRYF